MTENNGSNMDLSDQNAIINENVVDYNKWISQFTNIVEWNTDFLKNFNSTFLANLDKISSIAKDILTGPLVKIDPEIVKALRLELSDKFVSMYLPKSGDSITLKAKLTIASHASDIFNITAFIVETNKKRNMATIRDVYTFSNTKLLTERFEDKFDSIIEDNKNLKNTINALNEKIDGLTKSMTTLIDVVNTIKSSTINKSAFSFASVATAKAAPMIDLSKDNTESMPPPSTPNSSLKRKNPNQETNSNNSKIKKVDTPLYAKRPMSKQQVVKNFDSSNPGTGYTSLNDNKWQKPRNDIRNEKAVANKLKKSFLKSVGTGTFEGLGAVDRPHCIQIKRIDNECDPEKIKEFLKNELNLKFKDFTEVTLEHQHFKAYKITISYLDKKVVNEKEKWPQGWVVNSFYPQKRSNVNSATNAFQFRGNNSSSTASNSSSSQVQN